MNLVAALAYWVIVILWLAVLLTVAIASRRQRRTLGTSKLLLLVVAIDTVRNIVENIYFGAYFGSQYGVFPSSIMGTLGQPALLILPKLFNVAAAAVVLLLLLYRWLPSSQSEKAKAERVTNEACQALGREMEEHRRLFETSVDLIIVTDKDRVLKRISKSCEPILGYQPSALLDRYGGDLVSENDIENLRNEMSRSIAGDTASMRNVCCGFRHRKGHMVPLELSGVWSDQTQRFFLIGRDMTASREASTRLNHLAHFDSLTKLPNRTSLVRDLDLQMLPTETRPLAIVMFDLDDFKDVNDGLGHKIGDCLLQRVAERLRLSGFSGASFYRSSGDEFVMLLADCQDPLYVNYAVEKILHSLHAAFDINDQRIVSGASAGIAFSPRDAATSEELLANVDLALYAAKDAGRGKSRVYMPFMKASAHSRLEINRELRSAVENKEFVLHFQPQVRLLDGAIVGVEALLRWNHPSRGLLAPNMFIEALAESPLAERVGTWILESACAAASRWHRKGHAVRAAVNLFPCQFADGNLAARVKGILARAGLPPSALELEITENIVLGNGAILASLTALREVGVHIAFDDFGTGYASLSCVAAYPLTRIKIDRSFVKNIDGNSSLHQTAIASSIIILAHNLGLSVTAEGVETDAQEAFLREKGCDEVQGFKYSRPVSLETLEQLITQAGAPLIHLSA